MRRAADGATALDLAAAQTPDVVVLDLMLPGIGGLEVCRRLRRDHPRVPVLMLTALGEEADRILGLEVGADDYVTKPFSPRELVPRVQAVRPPRLGGGGHAGARDGRGPSGEGRRRPRARRSSARRDPCRPMSWPSPHGSSPSSTGSSPTPASCTGARSSCGRCGAGSSVTSRTVTVHVRRLREKVEVDPSNPRRLVTVFGVGYRWDAQPSDAA